MPKLMILAFLASVTFALAGCETGETTVVHDHEHEGYSGGRTHTTVEKVRGEPDDPKDHDKDKTVIIEEKHD